MNFMSHHGNVPRFFPLPHQLYRRQCQIFQIHRLTEAEGLWIWVWSDYKDRGEKKLYGMLIYLRLHHFNTRVNARQKREEEIDTIAWKT